MTTSTLDRMPKRRSRLEKMHEITAIGLARRSMERWWIFVGDAAKLPKNPGRYLRIGPRQTMFDKLYRFDGFVFSEPLTESSEIFCPVCRDWFGSSGWDYIDDIPCPDGLIGCCGHNLLRCMKCYYSIDSIYQSAGNMPEANVRNPVTSKQDYLELFKFNKPAAMDSEIECPRCKKWVLAADWIYYNTEFCPDSIDLCPGHDILECPKCRHRIDGLGQKAGRVPAVPVRNPRP